MNKRGRTLPGEQGLREVDEAIGKQIRGLRAARGLSQEELGDRIGVSYQQIQKYEAGTSSLSAPRLDALRKALGVSLDDLFPRNGEMAALPLSVTAIELGKNFDLIDDGEFRDALLTLARQRADMQGK